MARLRLGHLGLGLGQLRIGIGELLLGDELGESRWWEGLGLGACSDGGIVVSHCKNLVER